ncbi:MAG: ABC transporter ATP-binding protein [Acetobacteraceae bacterium]
MALWKGAPAVPVSIRLERVSASFRHATRGPVNAVTELDLEVRQGELLTLLGPSGCGKTTTLRMIAGFQEPSGGRIWIGDADVTRLPASHRNIGFVFQNYALFPHLTIFENVAYGLRVQHRTEPVIREAVAEVLALVDLAGYEARLPNELSGGQQQRVALARAIIIRPRVLLFDEPLSNLDAQLRMQMRGEIQRLQKTLGITTVYVTHDQEEAMAISDRIAVMAEGRLAQLGSAEELYRRPLSTFVASFLGRTNLLGATATPGRDGSLSLEIAGGHIVLRDIPDGSRYSGRVCAVVRPETIDIVPAGSGLSARVTTATYLGEKIEYVVWLADEPIHVVRFNPPEGERYLPGSEVALRFPREGIQILTAETT